ncbi:unnamed protein product [Pleuronectes platessa]|uniref:Uncharacterized protein n=1 Tax=Pleuronectes platessa TaxID=8262 RepID=A0A9N7TJ13_PLEPL|nr:unnamed protein product [Pleuronectes platessa]
MDTDQLRFLRKQRFSVTEQENPNPPSTSSAGLLCEVSTGQRSHTSSSLPVEVPVISRARGLC